MNTTDSDERVQTACPHAVDAPAHALGRLAEPERTAFERHAAGCPVCAQAMADAAQVIGRLRADAGEECAADFAGRVMADVREVAATAEPIGGRALRFPTPWVRIAAVLAVALGLGAMVATLRRGPPPATPSVPEQAAVPDAGEAHRQAMAWLARAQQPDGRWRAAASQATNSHDVGVSALALLALMESAAPRLDGESGGAVRAGVEFLLSQQNEAGLFGPAFSGATYNQGLATLAMVNACALERNERWRAAAEQALRFIVSVQDRSGGWSYFRGAEGTANSSASVWPLVALLRADAQGFAGLKPSADRGLRWMRAVVSGDGLMGYQRANEAPDGYDTLTAAGAFCLLRAGAGPDERRLLQNMLPRVRALAADAARPLDFYRSFFVSEALTAGGGKAADGRGGQMSARLLALQERAGTAAGSWQAADRWAAVGGPVYSTALAAMTLAKN